MLERDRFAILADMRRWNAVAVWPGRALGHVPCSSGPNMFRRLALLYRFGASFSWVQSSNSEYLQRRQLGGGDELLERSTAQLLPRKRLQEVSGAWSR